MQALLYFNVEARVRQKLASSRLSQVFHVNVKIRTRPNRGGAPLGDCLDIPVPEISGLVKNNILF